MVEEDIANHLTIWTRRWLWRELTMIFDYTKTERCGWANAGTYSVNVKAKQAIEIASISSRNASTITVAVPPTTNWQSLALAMLPCDVNWTNREHDTLGEFAAISLFFPVKTLKQSTMLTSAPVSRAHRRPRMLFSRRGFTLTSTTLRSMSR